MSIDAPNDEVQPENQPYDAPKNESSGPSLPNNASTREQTTNPPNPKTCMMPITDSAAQTYSRRTSPTRHQGPDGAQGPTSYTQRDPYPTAPPLGHSTGLRYKPPSQPPKSPTTSFNTQNQLTYSARPADSASSTARSGRCTRRSTCPSGYPDISGR